MSFPEFTTLDHGKSPYLAVHPADAGLAEYDVRAGDYDYARHLFGVKGKIWREEAMTLHSLAKFSTGPVLELGCFHGASTIVLCRANKDVTTVDLSEDAIGNATKAFAKHHVFPRIIHADAAAGIRRLIREERKYSFVFVDHDHGYKAVQSACRVLPEVLAPNAYLYFHDFQDERNGTGEYGVYQAVRELLSDKLDFVGLSGHGAIFQRNANAEAKTT